MLTDNLYQAPYGMNISYKKIKTPAELKKEIPVSRESQKTIQDSKKTIENILSGQDKRIFGVVGPCSIHNIGEAMEYGSKLYDLQKKVGDKMHLVMRAYLEKPRTSTGWKGILNDPDLNGTCNCEKGISYARFLLSGLTSRNISVGTEFLDLTTPEYLSDLVSWVAIGARTSESQPHRQMASGLSIPVGIKNNTSGDILSAINGVKASRSSHNYISRGFQGSAEIKTRGNKYSHIILRGGREATNYDPNSINSAINMLKQNNLPENLVIDCSHGNCHKNAEKQPYVFYEIIKMISQGTKEIRGFMLESNLKPGKQKIPDDLRNLKRGVSITDACLGWKQTEKMILDAYDIL